MSIFIARGTHNQADIVHRDKENRQGNYISHAEKTPYFDRDCYESQELALLAKKMISDCYSQKKFSKEIALDFLIGIKNLREGL